MINITDDIGQSFYFEKIPQRIISLVPSVTYTFFDLQSEHLLVGRTKFCILPKTKVASIPVVGGTKQIHIDRIIELQPDLVICNQEENTLEIFEQLKSAGIPTVVTITKNLEDNSRLIQLLGTLTQQSSLAEKINEQITASMQEVKNIFQQKTTIYLIWKDPYMTIGQDTFIHDMLEQIGIVNCFQDQNRYPSTDIREIAELRPDYLLLSSEPYPFQQKHLEEFQKLLPGTKVMLVDGEYFSWHGSMIRHSAEYFKEMHKKLQIS